MFKEGGFEIYEYATQEYVVKNIYNEPDGPSKYILEVREVLDEIKRKFYELEENTASWEDKNRARISAFWVIMLRKATGSIRLQGVQMALEDLTNAGYNVFKLQASGPLKTLYVLVDSEEDED